MDAGTLELVELDNALDFDVVCEQPSGCSKNAEWFGVTDCGCQAHYACTAHMIEAVQREAAMVRPRCNRCKVAPAEVIWTHLKQLRRIASPKEES